MNEEKNKPKMALIQSTNYTDWPMGGTLTYINNLIPTLDKRYRMHIWGIDVTGRPNKTAEILGKDYKLYKYANVVTGRKIPLNFVRVYKGMKKHAEKLTKYDIAFVHSGTELMAIKKTLGDRAPFLVFIQHGIGFLHSKVKQDHYYYMYTSKYSVKHADLSLIVSDEDTFSKFIQRKDYHINCPIYAVGAPIDRNLIKVRESNTLGDTVKFVYAGRFSPEKQPEYALKAFSYYLKEYSENATLTYIGDGPMNDELRHLVHEMKLDDKVIFTGKVSHEELISELKDYDIMLTPSQYEGFGLSSVEAMAAGLPVVAFDVEGLKGIIKNGVNGYLTEPFDNKKFAEGMKEAVTNFPMLSKNAIETAGPYDAEVFTNHLCDIIDENYKKYLENKNK